MKLKLLPFLLSLLLIGPQAISQTSSGGPDLFGYTYRDNTAPNGPQYLWFDISTIGTAVTGLSDDNFVGPFSISGFTYYTGTPSALYIGSNGYIAFTGVNISSSAAQFPAIPTLGAPNNFIAPMLTDLTFGGASSNPAQCYFYASGDTIAVTWEGVPFWTNNTNQYAGDNSFQVILNKADSSITFNYKKQSGSPDPTYVNNYLSIGIENATGSDGLQYVRGTTFPPANRAVKYYFPSVINPLTDVSLNWVDNDANGGIFKMVNQNYLPRLNVKNEGNQAITGNIRVGYRLLTSANVISDSNSTTFNGLGVGEDTTIVFNKLFSINQADRYDYKGYVSAVNFDNIRSNDTTSILLTALDTGLTAQDLDYTDQVGSLFSISWIGGNGGVAVYMEPPYYPARVLSTNFFITATGSPPAGFHSVLYDDSGRQGSFGNILDSASIAALQITPQSYYSHSVAASNITIASGGVYLLWLMDGPGVALGRVIQNPASQRTFEVLNGAWSRYRDADDEDFNMGIQVAPVSTDLEEGVSSLKDFKVYPNPARDIVTVELEASATSNDYQLMDLSGKHVDAKIMNYGNELKLFRGKLKAGTYILRVGKSIAKIQFTD